MTSTQTMHSIQRFTAEGKIGVALLLTSPFASGACYAWLLHGLASEWRQNDLFAPSVLLIVSGLAFIIGALAVLIGREQITTVTSVEAQQPRHMTYTEEANIRAARA